MNVKEVDVGDTVKVIRGNWAQQTGIVIHKSELFSAPGEPQKALFNIRLESFGRTIQKRNQDVEKTASAP